MQHHQMGINFDAVPPWMLTCSKMLHLHNQTVMPCRWNRWNRCTKFLKWSRILLTFHAGLLLSLLFSAFARQGPMAEHTSKHVNNFGAQVRCAKAWEVSDSDYQHPQINKTQKWSNWVLFKPRREQLPPPSLYHFSQIEKQRLKSTEKKRKSKVLLCPLRSLFGTQEEA